MSDVSESHIFLTKNERMSESLIFWSESLIRSFLDKKQAIPSEIKWANSQPCYFAPGWFEEKDALKKWMIPTKPNYTQPKWMLTQKLF